MTALNSQKKHVFSIFVSSIPIPCRRHLVNSNKKLYILIDYMGSDLSVAVYSCAHQTPSDLSYSVDEENTVYLLFNISTDNYNPNPQPITTHYEGLISSHLDGAAVSALGWQRLRPGFKSWHTCSFSLSDVMWSE
jgi:hypothetical protein